MLPKITTTLLHDHPRSAAASGEDGFCASPPVKVLASVDPQVQPVPCCDLLVLFRFVSIKK